MRLSRRWTKIIVLGALCVGCGSEHPMAPVASVPVSRPPVSPPTPSVDWEALARLFDDPLYRGLPSLLRDSESAEPLVARVAELSAAIQNRDVESLERVLAAMPADREAYAARPGYTACESVLLIAMKIVELRGETFMEGSSR
jgi:hypothetical protein